LWVAIVVEDVVVGALKALDPKNQSYRQYWHKNAKKVIIYCMRRSNRPLWSSGVSHNPLQQAAAQATSRIGETGRRCAFERGQEGT
jgi:trehalose utilization protein